MKANRAVQHYRFPMLESVDPGPPSHPFATEAVSPPPDFNALLEEHIREHDEAIRKEAYEEGRIAGFNEGVAAAEDDFASREQQSLEKLVLSIETAEGRISASMADIETSLVSALKTLVRRLAPRLLEAGYGARLEEIVSDAITRTRADTALELRLNSNDAARFGDKIMALAASRGRTVEVIGINRIPAGSCDLRWGVGGARFDGREMLEALSIVLDDTVPQSRKEGTP